MMATLDCSMTPLRPIWAERRADVDRHSAVSLTNGADARFPLTVIPGLVPGIHVGPTLEHLLQRLRCRPDVDGRDKPRHDEEEWGDKCQNHNNSYSS